MVAPRKRTHRCQSHTIWHAAFLAMVPTIREMALSAFRHLRAEGKEDAVDEVICNACVAFQRLVEQGKMDLAYPTPLAQYAIKQVRDDRKVGNRRSITDVSNRYCQRMKNVKVERLDRFGDEGGCWLEAIVEDYHAGPAETAAARIDIADWFRRMSEQRTWNSQISNFVYLAESDKLFAMCDQWFRGPKGLRVPIDESLQLWLPVTFDPATGRSAAFPLRAPDEAPCRALR